MKNILMLCTVFLVTACLVTGGVLATFNYAKAAATSKDGTVGTSIEEFVYGGYPKGFTKSLQSIIGDAVDDATYGLNAASYQGMKYAILFSQVFGLRTPYGYVGSMDATYGQYVYGKDAVDGVSIVLTYSKEVVGEQRMYMYLVKKSNVEIGAMEEDDRLSPVYRATFVQVTEGESASTKWVLKTLPDGAPDVRAGYSVVKKYEGQENGAKTFGYYQGGEIFVEDGRCSRLYERRIEGYDETEVTVEYDDCNPFGMIAGDFGEIASLSKHTSKTASDSTIGLFHNLGTLFATYMTSKTDEDYTAFYAKAMETYNNSLVSFTKNISTASADSARIGINHDYVKSDNVRLTESEDSDTLSVAGYKEAIARLFGFGSDSDPVNAFSGYATQLATEYEGYSDDSALSNGCFKAENGSFIFPIAVKNDNDVILTYVILDNGNVSVWVNDITATLRATNYSENYTTGGDIINELYCKNILFATDPLGEP